MLRKCVRDGRSGWQYGDTGKCFIGINAKAEAIKQGIAIQKSLNISFKDMKF